MKSLSLGLLLVAAIGAPSPAVEIDWFCDGVVFQGISYNDCLRGVYLSTSISDALCDTACAYSLHAYLEIRASCGGGSETHTLSGSLACGQISQNTIQYGGSPAAWANFTCVMCQPYLPPDPY